MDTESQKLMQEQFTKLPVELQTALKSPKLHEQIRIIGQKYQLHIDQVGKLEDEVIMFMMGFSEPEEFISQLANQLKIEFAAAASIASDIGKDIMIPIRDSMKSADEKVSNSSNQSAPAAVKISTPPPPVAPKPPVAPAPALQKPLVAPPPPVVPPKPTAPHPADLMLTQKTVSVAPQAPKPQPAAPVVPKPAAPPAPAAAKPATPPPPAPQPYKADPYREPTN